MSRTLTNVMDGLAPDRRARIEARADDIHNEYLTLKAIRAQMAQTQQALAANMGVAQATVAQMERRNDILVSTLRKYVEGLGGTLSIVVDMPGRPPVPLTGLGDRRLAEPDETSESTSPKITRRKNPVNPRG